jgi:pimeloyl-ACP methyl ester carboxylesterase
LPVGEPGVPDGRGRPGRRAVLKVGFGGMIGVAAAGVGGVELVNHGVLPGKQLLDRIDGVCSVPVPPLVFAPSGPSFSGAFYSAARRRAVGYTIAYPPGHRPGDELPLIVALHGYGGDHRRVLTRMSLAQALALCLPAPAVRVRARALPPMAMVAADGGGGYWNPHPGDDPLGMVIDELIPRCQARGLGRPSGGSRRIGTIGISMGGYGAILLAEKHPELFGAVAAIGPAIWTSYAQARAVNEGAYASAAAFAAADAVTQAGALAGVAVRVASGTDDPFHPGVEALVRALPPDAVVDLAPGCHTGSFFAQQEPASLEFLAKHIAASGS